MQATARVSSGSVVTNYVSSVSKNRGKEHNATSHTFVLISTRSQPALALSTDTPHVKKHQFVVLWHNGKLRKQLILD